MHPKTESLWIGASPETQFPPLSSDLTVDVVVVGAGVSGLTAALFLQEAGRSVAVIEQHHVGAGESGHTTAHLTEVLDTRYHRIIGDFGLDRARAVASSSRTAIDQIQRTAEQLGIDAEFKRVPAFLYAESRSQVADLKQELDALHEAGVAADWVEGSSGEVPLPFATHGVIRLEGQAAFHPRRYLVGIARRLVSRGGHVFEQTQATEMRDGEPCVVVTPRGRVHARTLIVAANTPSSNLFTLHTKQAAYRTYAVAGRIDSPPLVDGLYWDASDPYHYMRSYGDLWIIGGEDHKTGLGEPGSFDRLEEYARSRFGLREVTHRWSGQILETVDGLPYIGLNPGNRHTYVATGFSGNGMTLGTIAGLLIQDLVLDRFWGRVDSSWATLYSPSRLKPLASAAHFVRENKDFPLCYVRDRIAGPEARSLEEIAPGEGKTMRMDGKRAAVFRDERGEVHAVSAVCPHMGCHVHFNRAERSWDCPCHGSRFGVDGELLNGPATSGLERFGSSEKEGAA